MGSFSIWHWLIVVVIVLVVFGGKGKISDIMGDFAKGIKSFKKGLADEEDVAKKSVDEAGKTLDHASVAPVDTKATEARKAG